MKTMENYKGERFMVETFFDHESKGRGGWNINCEVSFKGEKKTFRHYTTDSMFIDQISDMKADDASWDEIQNAYKEKAFDSIEESILEWCEEINEKEEETWHCQETIGGWRQNAVFSGTYEECREYNISHNGQYAIVSDDDYEVDYL